MVCPNDFYNITQRFFKKGDVFFLTRIIFLPKAVERISRQKFGLKRQYLDDLLLNIQGLLTRKNAAPCKTIQNSCAFLPNEDESLF